jgi:peptidoglycan/LPS O-acetylase OafA/YrhL
MRNGITTERQQNNFDFLRVFAALCVTFAHSFNHVYPQFTEPLYALSGGRLTFADIGLCIFFSVSGFLIVKSAHQSVSFKNYIWKRLLRIQPMLVLLCLLTVFVLGPLFTVLSTKEYFFNGHTWTYFRNIMPLFGLQFNLPGVFESFAGEKGVNGSLWTLIVEERLYLLVAVVYFAVQQKRSVLSGVVILFNSAYFTSILRPGFGIPFFEGHALFYAVLFLNAGLYFQWYNNSAKQNNWYIMASALLIMASWFLPGLHFLHVVAVPVLVIGLATKKTMLSKAGKYGDFTYGIYIFSFPVQQMLSTSAAAGSNPYKLFGLTLLFVLPAAIISWHFVEKKMLLLKNKVQ